MAAAIGGAVSAAVGLVAICLPAGVAALRRRLGPRPAADGPDDAVFLFDGDDLRDATPPARSLLAHARKGRTARERTLGLLRPRFPDLDDRIAGLAPGQDARLDAVDGTATLEVRATPGRMRLTLLEAGPGDDADTGIVAAFAHEMETLRTITETAPLPIWRQGTDGTVTWVNRAYLDLVQTRHPEASQVWPPPRLFDTEAAMADDTRPRRARRLCLPAAGEAPDAWFECHFIDHGDEVLVSAVDVDAMVRAEGSLREFVQTLSKTFAHLTVGLAVFGKDRRLMMFNPALTDLTRLPPAFLVGQPTLVAFLDALRTRKMMPEPKDYRSWRDRLSTLESEIADGTFSEIWNLPFDRTYRITGRPQPDGAMALLFEDISAEMGLTRRFRTELDAGQAIFDALPEGIAVFDGASLLIRSNRAYDALWGGDSQQGIVDVTAADTVRRWAAACPPSPLWDDIAAWLGAGGDRADRTETIRLDDGRAVTAGFTTLPGGAAMVRFSVDGAGTGSGRATPGLVAPPVPDGSLRIRDARVGSTAG